MVRPPQHRLLALTIAALALLAALAAPAGSLPQREIESEGAWLVGVEPHAAALRTRAGERSVEKPVLSPGMHWIALPELPLVLRDPARTQTDCARADERTLRGWCLAHSTSTALG